MRKYTTLTRNYYFSCNRRMGEYTHSNRTIEYICGEVLCNFINVNTLTLTIPHNKKYCRISRQAQPSG